MPPQVNCALPPGFELDQYRIHSQLSLGGFSIVYLAHDRDETPVAIKEYLPNALALREDGQITPNIPEEFLPAFRYGMKCFFEEGRALAGLNHPNVVRVLNFFRANETVYMVMRYERGRTLQEYITRRRGEIRESFIRYVFTRLLNGLREVHAHKLLHLDLKPSNIYLRNNGSPVLLDFGAARTTLMADTPMLKPMYTPGFAAPEHYRNRDLLGPWSDIYSVGASMYACLSGGPPQAADQRLDSDSVILASQRWIGQYSPQLLETIDWCMDLNHLKRPQTRGPGRARFAGRARGTGRKHRRQLAGPRTRPAERAGGQMRFTIFQESRVGKRKSNQDRMAYSYSRDALLMVIADGMGGHLQGEVAAQIAVQYMVESFQREAKPRLADPFLFLSRGLTNAHCAILDYADERDIEDGPRTTCVACVIQDSVAYWAHAGDSRLYVLRAGHVMTQTRDHSRVQRMIDRGLLDEDGAMTHPHRNRIYSCLGGPIAPQIEYSRKTPLLAGDTVFLCSDGVWGPLGNDQLLRLFTEIDVMQAVPRVMDSAEAAGGETCDNLTMVALNWHDSYAEEPRGSVTTKTLPLDRHTTVLEGFGDRVPIREDWDESAIEAAISEINSAINKYSSKGQ